MKDPNYDFPKWVRMAFIAGTTKYMCGESRIPESDLPEAVQQFIKDNPEEPAYEYAEKIMQSSPDMPIEELEKWVNNMSGCSFFRAEMRSVLKQRKGLTTT